MIKFKMIIMKEKELFPPCLCLSVRVYKHIQILLEVMNSSIGRAVGFKSGGTSFKSLMLLEASEILLFSLAPSQL